MQESRKRDSKSADALGGGVPSGLGGVNGVTRPSFFAL
jgi:hypothetical protein